MRSRKIVFEERKLVGKGGDGELDEADSHHCVSGNEQKIKVR